MTAIDATTRIELERRIRMLAGSFAPLPTHTEPRLPRLAGMGAVIFDVYGTLMLSAAGDIGVHEESAHREWIDQALHAAGFTGRFQATPFRQAWLDRIHESHRADKARGIACPEIEVRNIWKTMVGDGLLVPPAGVDLGTAMACLALEYEMRSNPVCLEPSTAATLRRLAAKGLRMGIVSNAQFYTPIILETLLGCRLEDAGIDHRLCVWSYEEGEAKPSQRLYDKLADNLRNMSLEPEQALYVGNDMLNDMLPASRAGFRTALYAGDARSLRLRKDHPDCRHLTPDAVITSIGQLCEVTGEVHG